MTQSYLGQITDTTQESGDDLAARLNAFDAAHKSNQAGTTRPSGIEPGGIWTKEVSAGVYALMLYDGAEDRALAIGQTAQADQMVYYTGADSAALTTLTPFARSVLDDTSALAARQTLGVAYASKAEAEDGGVLDRAMSPLRVAQRIAAMFADQAAAEAGTATGKLMTPLGVAQAIAAQTFGLGGQTNYDKTSERVATSTATKYQNTTNRPMLVNVKVSSTGSFGFRVATDATSPGFLVTQADSSALIPHVFMVPPGHFYWCSIASTRPVALWVEYTL